MQKLQVTCSDLSSDDNRRTCIALCEPAECCHENGEEKKNVQETLFAIYLLHAAH